MHNQNFLQTQLLSLYPFLSLLMQNVKRIHYILQFIKKIIYLISIFQLYILILANLFKLIQLYITYLL